MLTSRERLLLMILMWLAVFVSAGLFMLSQVQRRGSLDERISALEQRLVRQYQSLNQEYELNIQKEAAQKDLEKYENRFYSRDDIDPYSFATTIRTILISNDLRISQYQTLEAQQDVTMLEFSVKGDALGFAGFLAEVSESEKYWNIPFVSLSSDEGKIQSVFRIHYETLDSWDR